jgi:glycosyltransferase involved in cell wall biosynthesis
MTFAAVHQFHSGTALGDAVTGQMLRLQDRLRRLGYVSSIFAEHVHPTLEHRIRPIESLASEPGTLLFVHHSMGHTAFDRVIGFDGPIVTVFHNITPPQYFDDEFTRASALLGIRQLHRLAQRSRLGVADSNHNRRMMFDAGFDDVEVLPVQSDFTEFRSVRRSDLRGSDWLFVGRVVPNKRQDDIVRAFALFRRWFQEGHLHLVGDLTFTPYVDRVRATIEKLGMAGEVTLHGKISHAELLDRYRGAGVFVCLSEHEGFGIPLLEAMAAGVPVIAARSSAIAETLGGAGVLLDPPHAEVICHAARLLTTDPRERRRMLDLQDDRLARLEAFDEPGVLDSIIRRADGEQRPPLRIQIEGPFETSYSLAIANRDLALALDRQGRQVTIHATEGPGDYAPSEADLAKHPRAAELHRAAVTMPYPDVSIRQMHPPRVDDSRAGLTLQYFGWEETGLPERYVRDFNTYLDGVGAMSSFVRDVLIRNGVTVPVEVMGNVVRAPDPTARFAGPEATEVRGHCFLHISSAFPRKGMDVLLRSYFQAFTRDDEVTLLLKTFPNPHNEVGALLGLLRATTPAGPRVVWIDRDLDRDELDGLYGLADTYVHPARGEGFGLPVAEAMLAGVPVISTAATGLADFVDETTATVVPHTMQLASTHLTTRASCWAEPDVGALVAHLARAVESGAAEERAERAERARERITERYSADAVASRWCRFIDEIRSHRPGVGVTAVTTYNTRCGIAEYAANLYRHMPGIGGVRVLADRSSVPVSADAEFGIERVWDNHRLGRVDDLITALDDDTSDVIHIQYNLGFFTMSELARLIVAAADRAPVVLTLHRTAPLLEADGTRESFDSISEALERCAAIIVHQTFDHDVLRELGITADVHVVPIGCDPPRPADPRTARRRNGLPSYAYIVGTYGFLLPHKGFIPLLEAVADLRRRGIDAFLLGACALHPDPRSQAYLVEVRRAITRLGMNDHVLLETEYLPDEASKDLLESADVIVLPYDPTEESASAAGRSVLPLCTPMITSTARIFDDLRGAVRQVPTPVDPRELSDVLESLWLEPDARRGLSERILERCITYSWGDVSRRTRDMYLSAVAGRRRASAEPVR